MNPTNPITRLKAWRDQNPFVKGVVEIAGGTWMGHAVTLLGAPILSRIYGPESFGRFQIYLSFLMVLSVILALRYEMAILLPEDDEGGFRLVVLGLMVSTIAGIGCLALMASLFALKGWPSILQPLGWGAFLIPVGAMLASIYQVLTFWAIRKSSFRSVSLSKLCQASSQVGGQVVGGFTSIPGHAGLMLGDCIGRIGALVPLLREFNRDLDRFTGRWSLASVLQVARRYRRFPLISAWGALINSLGLTVPSIMLLHQLGADVLGWYALADRVVGLPSVLLGQSVSQVFMGEAGRLSTGDPRRMLALYRGLLKKLMLIGLVPAAVLLIGGPWVFRFVFGPHWGPAGQMARILALNHYLAFIAWPLIPTLTVLERQDLQTAWDVGRLAFIVAALAASQAMGLGMPGTIGMLSTAGALSYLTHVFITHQLLTLRAANYEKV